MYSRVSSPLPRQLPDSRKRSFLSYKAWSEGGGEEGTEAQGTAAPMSERRVQALTHPTQGPSRAAAGCRRTHTPRRGPAGQRRRVQAHTHPTQGPSRAAAGPREAQTAWTEQTPLASQSDQGQKEDL